MSQCSTACSIVNLRQACRVSMCVCVCVVRVVCGFAFACSIERRKAGLLISREVETVRNCYCVRSEDEIGFTLGYYESGYEHVLASAQPKFISPPLAILCFALFFYMDTATLAPWT